jgi:hypothetical protein
MFGVRQFVIMVFGGGENGERPGSQVDEEKLAADERR